MRKILVVQEMPNGQWRGQFNEDESMIDAITGCASIERAIAHFDLTRWNVDGVEIRIIPFDPEKTYLD